MKAVQEQKRARDLTADDRAALIRRLEFGSTLDDSLVADLARSSVVLDFRRRRFVYRAGEPADCLYAIVRGRIKLCRDGHIRICGQVVTGHFDLTGRETGLETRDVHRRIQGCSSQEDPCKNRRVLRYHRRS